MKYIAALITIFIGILLILYPEKAHKISNFWKIDGDYTPSDFSLYMVMINGVVYIIIGLWIATFY